MLFRSPLILNNEKDGVPGSEKKKKVIQDLKSFANNPANGVTLPPILVPYEDQLFGLMIDVLVNIFNSNGFFKSSSGS